MKAKVLIIGAAAIVAGALAGAVYTFGSQSGDATTVAALAGETHFHGLAADAADPEQVFLATHHGLYRVAIDGTARLVSESRDDFMGFTPHPSDPSVLYASGHPAGGGNMGIIVSRDGGATWSRLAAGVAGPVDFHQMAASIADPAVIYGVHGGLQKSADGGKTWVPVGAAPEGLFSLATSNRNADILYAGTRNGLLRSSDGGRNWRFAHPTRRTATMVHVEPGGQIYAFIIGEGLVRADEDKLDWRPVSNDFGAAAILHFAVGRASPETYFAVTYDTQSRAQSLRLSRDGGRTWRPFGAP